VKSTLIAAARGLTSLNEDVIASVHVVPASAPLDPELEPLLLPELDPLPLPLPDPEPLPELLPLLEPDPLSLPLLDPELDPDPLPLPELDPLLDPELLPLLDPDPLPLLESEPPSSPWGPALLPPFELQLDCAIATHALVTATANRSGRLCMAFLWLGRGLRRARRSSATSVPRHVDSSGRRLPSVRCIPAVMVTPTIRGARDRLGPLPPRAEARQPTVSIGTRSRRWLLKR